MNDSIFLVEKCEIGCLNIRTCLNRVYRSVVFLLHCKGRAYSTFRYKKRTIRIGAFAGESCHRKTIRRARNQETPPRFLKSVRDESKYCISNTRPYQPVLCECRVSAPWHRAQSDRIAANFSAEKLCKKSPRLPKLASSRNSGCHSSLAVGEGDVVVRGARERNKRDSLALSRGAQKNSPRYCLSLSRLKTRGLASRTFLAFPISLETVYPRQFCASAPVCLRVYMRVSMQCTPLAG